MDVRDDGSLSGGKSGDRFDERFHATMSAAHQGREDGIRRRERWLAVFAETRSIKKACQAVQVKQATYETWRRRHLEFRQRVDAIRTTDPADVQAVSAPQGFAGFRKTEFGMESPWFHIDAIRHIEAAEPGRITLILFPPEHGKTTLIEDFAAYKLARDPSFRITVGAERSEHSQKVLGRVRNRMEPDGPFPEYVAKYGPFAPQTGTGRASRQPWGDKRFNVNMKQSHDERDWSMQALGITGSIIGSRTDLLVCDDLQSRKSLNRTDELFEVWRQDWLTRPGAKAPTVVLGSRVGNEDFYEKLMESEILDNIVIYPAHSPDYGWLWPERYSEDEYAILRRNAGEEAWARNYMMDPKAGKDGPFGRADLEECRNPVRSTFVGVPPETARTVIGLDPGYGRNAVVVCAQSRRKLYVLDARADLDLVSTHQIFQVVEEEIAEWGCDHLVIEDKAFQKGLLEDPALERLRRRYGFNVAGHNTGEHKYDPDIGIPAMARDVVRRLLDLPYRDRQSQDMVDPLVNELVDWRPYIKGTRLTQDLVMALWFCWMDWRDHRQTLHSGRSDRTIRTEALPWEPRSARSIPVRFPAGVR